MNLQFKSKKNRKIDTVPFDRYKVPPKQNFFAMPFIWLGCFFITRTNKLKIKKVGMENLKPPFLVIGTHHSFTDFYVAPLALFPYRANYVSELEGFEAYGEWLYRQSGCLGTRKFVSDLALVKNIKKVIDRGDILVLFPEARYANVGTNSKLDASVGKLAKLLNVPVVVLNMRGNYLKSPIWNTAKRKEAILETTITQVFTAKALESATVDEVNAEIQKHLAYDEYAWQYEEKIAITHKKRAEGLELALYMCPCCGAEFHMKTKDSQIFCVKCDGRWIMTEYGKMEVTKEGLLGKVCNPSIDFSHIPNWYEWQRNEVIKKIDEGRYLLSTRVHIESLPNAVNFIDLGEGLLVHEEKGFSLKFTEFGETEAKTLFFSSSSMSSIHTEYNYREKKGQCITLSTLDNTYFLYPMEEGFNATKIQFATEYLYERNRKTGMEDLQK